MILVAVNGYPCSGKTQFGKFCKDILGSKCAERSSIDRVKEIATECGWDGSKIPENRKFLSDLKDLLSSYNNLPLKDIKEHMRLFADESEAYGIDTSKYVFLSDIREPEELAKAKSELGAITVFIDRRVEAIQSQSNHADSRVEDFSYDYYIDNNGTLEDLYEATSTFLDQILENK